jgi:hypothetical protein
VQVRTVAIAALACGAMACTPAGPTATPTHATIAAPIESPSAAELNAIRYRTEFGLRADLAYIRAVAANPLASSVEFGIPLLPAELAELNSRAASVDAIKEIVIAYTEAHPDEFAGIYIDQEHGGLLTTMWTANVALHEAAIRAKVRPGAPLAFRSAKYPLSELQTLRDRISGDWNWMRGFAIAPIGVGVDQINNRVEVDVSTVNGNASALILAHYAVPAGMIVVQSDGTGAALLPWGTVRGRVVDSRGQPPGAAVANGLALGWVSDGPGTCGLGDMGYGVGADGVFEVPCQVAAWTMQIQLPAVAGGSPTTIGSGHVVVLASQQVLLQIKLDKPWALAVAP